jgi:hypothetical protein
MPSGTVSYTTRASNAIEDTTYYSATFSNSLLLAGNNVIAVEIHQADPTSSDISFDFELKGTVTSSAPQPPATTEPTGPTAPTEPTVLFSATTIKPTKRNLLDVLV